MRAAGRPEMADDPRMADNAGRVKHEPEIDTALADWCASIPSTQVMQELEDNKVPVGPIYNVEDLINDPHFQARGLFEQVEIDGKPLSIPAIMPKLSDTPGRTDWPGGEIGSHSDEILDDILKIDPSEKQALKAKGVI